MAKLKLKFMSYGWGGSDVPDNIEFAIQTESGTSYEMAASLQQLAILYDSIANRRESSFFIGTGTSVDVRDGGEDMEINIGRVTLTESESLLRERIESLLKEIFKKADEKDPTRREESLNQINIHIKDFHGGFDFKSLYRDLSDRN